ncbi:MAG: stage IV sporulation protein A [Clostridia bacterium]|nr:stage IV sporulation protein A [Clostridia bacterium]
MENYSVYEDIASRTNGDIYIGVVGPVRTGKSTFIKRFMEKMVIPSADPAQRAVMTDELPQSAAGKTVMTTEPKFVPAKAAKIAVAKGAEASVRLVDCVGFSVAGASGFEEDGAPRLVKTAWSEDPISFEEAATLGTEKVIKEHSTIGVLVTTDGSVTDIPRENYLSAEERSVSALKEIDKPFVILLNCRQPEAQETLRQTLEEKYDAPVVAVNVETMGEEEIVGILQKALFEFPVSQIDIRIPDWIRALPEENPTVAYLTGELKKAASKIFKMKDCFALENLFTEGDFLPPDGVEMQLGRGRAEITVKAKEELFYKVLSEECGENLENDLKLMQFVKRLSESNRRYEKIKDAFAAAEEKGYGVVQPTGGELDLDKPQLVRKNGGYGVRFKADAASYHIIKIGVTGEIQSIVGTKQQSEAFIEETLQNYSEDREKVWQTNIFGKSLYELMQDEFAKKAQGMPPEISKKIKRVITRVVNDGKGGIFCILI